MNNLAPFFPVIERRLRKREKIQTTLNHLIEVINEEVDTGEEDLVVQTVLDLINKGWLRFPRSIQR